MSTQLPYAASCAVISGLCYILAGVLVEAGLPGLLALPVGVVAYAACALILPTKSELY